MSTSSAMDLVTGKTESWPVNETSKTNETGLPYSLPEMTLIAIVAGFLSLLTVVGNCMVMISFKIDKQLQTISNYFLFSLAVADFAIGLISMPLYTMYILTGSWQLGPHMCDTWLSLDYLASNASVLNLLIISFDRYFSVTRPLTYRARRTPRRAGIMIAAAWLISLVLWPPWIYSWPHIEGKRTVPEGECYIQFFETNNYITFGTAIAAFYVPVTVMCILYWKVWRETEKRQKDLSNLQAGKKNDSHRSNSSNEEQAAIEIDEWRRSRSESSGAIDEIETTYVPASAYLTGIRQRRQRMAGWRNIRNWRRFLSWSYLRRLVWCRGRHRGTPYEDESYSDASNAATPGSVETPLASTISHGVSVNAIRDPYSHPRHRLASRSQSTGVADPLGSPDGDALGNRAQSADSVFTILIRLPRDPDKEEHPTIRMIPANPPHRPKPPQAYHPPANRPRSVPLGPPPPGPASNSSKFMSNSSSLLCGTNLQLTEAFSLSKLTSLAKPNHLPLKGAKLKSNASPWVPRSCMPVAQSPLLPRSTSRFPGDGSNRPSDNSALPLDAKIIPRQLASRPVSTVSGNVSAPQTPNRRNRYQVHNPQALAKKNGKKPKKKKNQEKKQERKAAKTLSAILLAFILTWTPYNVLILLKALAKCDDDCFPEQLWNFSYYLCYINSTINPVCYALCNASFRRTYVRILTCKWHSRTKTAVQRGFYN